MSINTSTNTSPDTSTDNQSDTIISDDKYGKFINDVTRRQQRITRYRNKSQWGNTSIDFWTERYFSSLLNIRSLIINHYKCPKSNCGINSAEYFGNLIQFIFDHSSTHLDDLPPLSQKERQLLHDYYYLKN